MKKVLLTIMVVAFAAALQAGDGCCAAQATKGKVAVSAKADGQSQCPVSAKQACSADKQACTAETKQACSADKQACTAEAKQACSAQAKDKAQCTAEKSACCAKAKQQVKKPLRSPKDT